MTSAELTRQIIEYLHRRGHLAWRNNTGRKGHIRFGLPGSSDILGVHKTNGRIIAIEVKVGKDKLSVAQDSFLGQVLACGGIAFVARNLDDVLKVL